MTIVRIVAFLAVLGLGSGPALAQISDGIIKIGVLNDQSSLYADLAGQGSVVAARMAVEDYGAAAKGLKVEIIFADHQNKADVGSQIARQWYDAEKVDLILDVPNSGVALAVNQITRDKGKAFVVSSAATSDLTGKACSPNTIHWTYDTWALANGTGTAVVKTGGDSWFFITADYAFGHALERDVEAVVLKNGGKVLGKVRHPLNTQDFSSFLLQAQASKAKVIGLANAGGDTTNAIKQGAEFGIVKGGQSFAGLLVFLTDVHALGLDKAQGLTFTETFYWDMNDKTRLRQALRRAQPADPSDDDPRRSLRGDAPLSEGRRGAQERRRRQGHRQDEGDGNRRSALRQGNDSRGRAQDSSRVPRRGQEAFGVEVSLGLL
jgi:branched-chain amino acid transport system substrate-binding protein